MASRHRSREVALQTLYALDMAARGDRVGPSVEETFETLAAHFEMPEAAKAFAGELVGQVSGHRPEIDEIISGHARNWRLGRMTAVDRNVLRLATYELLHSETPTAVVIDEAVLLAQAFGNDSSPSFVNGILDAVAHSVRESVA